MKVIISTMTRFHAFSLAEQMQKRGHLHKLVVGYFDPTRNAKGFDIDPDRVVKNVLPVALGHIPSRVPPLEAFRGLAQYGAHALHDLWARSQLEPCDVFVGWSGASLLTIRKAREMGAVTVVERGSAHMLRQKEILEEGEQLTNRCTGFFAPLRSVKTSELERSRLQISAINKHSALFKDSCDIGKISQLRNSRE